MRWSRGLPHIRPILFAFLPALVVTSVAAGDLAFVTNQNGSDLSIIDLDRQEERARIPVPGEPAGIAVDAAGARFYTVSAGSKVLRQFDLDGELLQEVTLDGGPIGIAVQPDSARVFVSDWYNARIWVLDAADLSVLTTLPTGAAPAGLVIDPQGRWVASADKDADQVSVFDLVSLTLRHRIPVGARPFGIAVGPDGRLFSADVGSNTVTVADPLTGTILGQVPVGERPYGIAFAAGFGFVTNQYADTVSVFDLTDLTPRATIPVGEYPEGIDATPDGSKVVVANWFSNAVSVIDTKTLTVTTEIATGDGPRAFGRFVVREGTGG